MVVAQQVSWAQVLADAVPYQKVVMEKALLVVLELALYSLVLHLVLN
jgi:hypothetical protein